jgi:hypothetical protein
VSAPTLDRWNIGLTTRGDFSPIPPMSEAMPQTARGRSQNRKRVAGGQDHKVRDEAKKTGTSKGRVKKVKRFEIDLCVF